mmetsp:Transcript_4385/g.13005  ORF Transcript_4385/g.13005 Transcript_4385/m.13005 type:complete len:381 (+) Transcript_4385:637-1779(+)
MRHQQPRCRGRRQRLDLHVILLELVGEGPVVVRVVHLEAHRQPAAAPRQLGRLDAAHLATLEAAGRARVLEHRGGPPDAHPRPRLDVVDGSPQVRVVRLRQRRGRLCGSGGLALLPLWQQLLLLLAFEHLAHPRRTRARVVCGRQPIRRLPLPSAAPAPQLQPRSKLLLLLHGEARADIARILLLLLLCIPLVSRLRSPRRHQGLHVAHRVIIQAPTEIVGTRPTGAAAASRCCDVGGGSCRTRGGRAAIVRDATIADASLTTAAAAAAAAAAHAIELGLQLIPLAVRLIPLRPQPLILRLELALGRLKLPYPLLAVRARGSGMARRARRSCAGCGHRHTTGGGSGAAAAAAVAASVPLSDGAGVRGSTSEAVADGADGR